MSCVGKLREAREECLNIEWRIDNFLSLPGQSGTYYFSPDIKFSCESLYMKMYPYDGSNRESSEWISMYLQLRNSAISIFTTFEFGIKTKDGTLCLQQTFIRYISYNSLHGTNYFLSRSELLRRKDELLTSGALTVVCRLRSFPPPTELNTAFANGLKDIPDSYSDVTIRVKDKEIRAHKNILAASSQVFSAMFEHEMSEKESGIVTIPDCEPDSFKGFLCFLYSSRTDFTDNNVYDIYSLAHKYGVQELMIQCAAFMIKNLSPNTFCDVAVSGYQYSDENLIFMCKGYFKTNVQKILTAPQWKALLKDHYLVAYELLESIASKIYIQG